MTMPRLSTDAPPAAAAPLRHALSGRAARATLETAAVLAVLGDLLLHDGPLGLAFPLWIATLALCATALAWRCDRTVTPAAAGWLLAAFLFACGTAWRSADGLHALDILATAFALGMAAVAIGRPTAGLLAPRLRTTVDAALAELREVAIGVLPLVFREVLARDTRARATPGIARTVRPVILAILVLLVFGALLRAADPLFASFVALPAIDMDTVLSHVVFMGFLGWIVAGWARGALLPESNPLVVDAQSDALPISLGMADINATLGTLIVLFGAFVIAQLGWFFGGEHLLHARTGLTAADYARGGFFQMIWVVLLVVPVLVGTRAMLRPGPALARRHTVLALPVIALLLVMVISALLRMRLYVHYYGLTIERFYPLVFMGWLVAVLLWLSATVLREWPRPFVAGAVISGLVLLGALNVADPDSIVARADVARGDHTRAGMVPLDLAHLSALSGDAMETAVHAVIAPPPGATGQCDAARTLLRRWGPGSSADRRVGDDATWRTWNAGDARGLAAVRSQAAALRAVTHEHCVKPTAATPSGGAATIQR